MSGQVRTLAAWLGSALLVLSGLLPPLHLHVEPDHDQAAHDTVTVIHRHFEGHKAASSTPTLSDHDPVLTDEDGLALDLEQFALAATASHAACVELAIVTLAPLPPALETIERAKAPQVDASPPNGPPKRPSSSRAPPLQA